MCGCDNRAAEAASSWNRAMSSGLADAPRISPFDGDHPTEIKLAGQVDDAHPPPAQFGQDLIFADKARGIVAVSERTGGVETAGTAIRPIDGFVKRGKAGEFLGDRRGGPDLAEFGGEVGVRRGGGLDVETHGVAGSAGVGQNSDQIGQTLVASVGVVQEFGGSNHRAPEFEGDSPRTTRSFRSARR